MLSLEDEDMPLEARKRTDNFLENSSPILVEFHPSLKTADPSNVL
jgi:hypothetical protein